MTPALLLALEEEHMRDVELLTLPIDKLAWMYANAHRDPGEKDEHGFAVRPAAPMLELNDFKTYGRRLRKTLAAKDDWDYTLRGAKASRAAFEAWAGMHSDVEFIPTPEA